MSASALSLQHGPLYRGASLLAGLAVRRLPGPDELVARVLRRTGLDASRVGPLPLQALEVLTRAYAAEARLNGFGRWAVRAVLEWHLAARFRSHAYAAEHPELVERALPPQLVITGLPRTGSTFLHRALAALDGTRSLALWEMGMPVPPPRDDGALDPRQRAARRFSRRLRAGATAAELEHFHQVHASEVDQPEECLFLLARAFTCSQFYSLLGHIPSYLAWADAAFDGADVYAGYVRDLRILLHERRGERLVLKAPAHLRHLDALFAALPRARVVWVHRDPLEVVPSACSLLAMYHRQLSDAVEPGRLGAVAVRDLVRDVGAAIRHCEAAPERVLHLRYADVVRAPADSLARILAFSGEVPSDEQRRALTAFCAANRQHRHGQHRYSLQDFSLEPAAVRARFTQYEAWYPAATSTAGASP